MNEIRIIAPRYKKEVIFRSYYTRRKVDARQQTADVQVPFE